MVILFLVDELVSGDKVNTEEHENEGDPSEELGPDVAGFVVDAGESEGFPAFGYFEVGKDETALNVGVAFFGVGWGAFARSES